MRDRRDNRDISPKYFDRSRRHHHVDRHHDDAPRPHKAAPRLVRVSGSPPVRAPYRRSPHRRDLMPRQPDHRKPMHRDYPSPHHPRSQHSPTVRDYHHHDHHIPSYMLPDYSTDLNHRIKHQPHGLDPQHVAGRKAMFLDDRTSRLGGLHDSELLHCHTHKRDLYGGDRDRDKDKDRDTEKGLYQREVPPPTVTATHLGSIDGGQSSYGHGRLYHDHALAAPEDISRVTLDRLPDDPLNRRESRDLVGDLYNNPVLDNVYGKMPYSSLGYSRVDDISYSPISVREGRVHSDLPHHSTHRDVGPVYNRFEQGYSARSLHRHEMTLPFEDRHEFHREVAHVEQRERPESPIFPDRGKGLQLADYISLQNGYADNLGYEPSHERLIAREDHLHHMHDHNHDHAIYDDRIFDDDDDDADNDDDGDEDGNGLNQRVTVKDRLNLSSPQMTDVNHPRIRRAVPSRKPVFIHGIHNNYHTMVAPAALQTNSIKKRLWLGPLDLRKENFRAHKIQRREMLDEPNIRNVNYKYEKGSDEDAADTVSPVNRDPPVESDEFKKQVERAFFKYARMINESSREKKKFLQPGKGSLVCYVCGRQSKEFAETHNLVVHTYHTQKPGLRTAHLGLQKALCLLMGWNWLMIPDESKQYQAGPPGEAKVLKQDLILWPPVVVICNSSIDNNTSESKIISIEMIESMLKEIGIEEGKAKVSYGKPSNLSVILVKFPPMISGFELAEKLHHHFSQANHGKEHLEYLLKSGTSTTSDKKAKAKEIEDVLYGYMAGIDDLDKLDSDTKKTYLAGKDTIRSKKVIKARIDEQIAA